MLAIMLQRIRTWLLRWLGVDGLEADLLKATASLAELTRRVDGLDASYDAVLRALKQRAQRFTPVTDYESSQIAAMAEFEEKKPNGIQI